MLMILLSTLSVLREIVDWGKMWFGKAGKTQFVSLDWSHNFGAIDVIKDCLFLKKNHFLRCQNNLSLLN